MSGPGTSSAPARGPATRWRHFARRYGWRAYAVPILGVVTVVALLHDSPSSGSAPAAQGHRGTVTVEGRSAQDANYRPGDTPAAVVVQLGSDVTSCSDNTYSKLLLVSVSQQHLWACQGRKQVDSTPVTTGAKVHHRQTPLGSWRVQGKQRNRYLVGPGYRDYVHYWMPFNGDFGLHDASWQTMPFGSSQWPKQGSHGCVHVPTKTMAWIYRWARVGNTVVTIEK